MQQQGQRILFISIHTLTWRVTCVNTPISSHYRHFNPHPHVEGDLLSIRFPWFLAHFNPHPHVEGDRGGYPKVKHYSKISIHTLTWRVTGHFLPRVLQACDFNPHPHVEGDP